MLPFTGTEVSSKNLTTFSTAELIPSFNSLKFVLLETL
jgi:hypothetical protein